MSESIIPESELVDVEASEISDYELNEDIDINELTPNSFSKGRWASITVLWSRNAT